MRAPLALLGACFGRSERPSARPCVKVHLGVLGAGTFILREALERASSQNEFVMSVTISAQVLFTFRFGFADERSRWLRHYDGVFLVSVARGQLRLGPS